MDKASLVIDVVFFGVSAALFVATVFVCWPYTFKRWFCRHTWELYGYEDGFDAKGYFHMNEPVYQCSKCEAFREETPLS
jgi:hypothetical protein